MKYNTNCLNALKGHTLPRAIQLNKELMQEHVPYARVARDARRWYYRASACDHGYHPTSRQVSDFIRCKPLGIYSYCWVLAVLSPNSTWKQNQKDAEAVIEAFTRLGHFGDIPALMNATSTCYAYEANRLKAFTFLLELERNGEMALCPPPGRKVGAFYQALVDHAHRVWHEVWVRSSAFPQAIKDNWENWGDPPIDLWMKRAYLHPNTSKAFFHNAKSYDVALYGLKAGYEDFMGYHYAKFHSITPMLWGEASTITIQQYQAMIWALVRRGAE
jgi:hypothetical protein